MEATAQKLTDEQIEAMIAQVEKTGRERRRTQGKKFNDVDFACGAMAVFFATGCQDRIPSNWIYYPLGNQDLFV